jgi:selenocysteine lyase/cysteine desulfurase
MDFSLVDFAVAGGQKWLMGAEGSGFIYAQGEWAARLKPRLASWLSHNDPVGFLFDGPGLLTYDRPIRQRIDFLERGSPNTCGYAALEAGIDLIAQIGIPNIYRHVNEWHDGLEPRLLERGFTSARSPDPARRSGILSVRPPTGFHQATLARELGTRGIACSAPDGYLRFSPHWPNNHAECELVIAALDDILRGPRKVG